MLKFSLHLKLYKNLILDFKGGSLDPEAVKIQTMAKY